MITGVVRLNDGMVVDVQASSLDLRGVNVGARIDNAMRVAGGEPEDWAVYAIPEAVWVEVDPLATQYVSIEHEAVVGLTQGEPFKTVEPEPTPSKEDLQAQINAIQAALDAME